MQEYIYKKKRLQPWDQPEIFRQLQNMNIYFKMLMGHYIVEFWVIYTVNFYF